MTTDEQIEHVNKALERCEKQTRATGEIRWSIAYAALLGAKARLINPAKYVGC